MIVTIWKVQAERKSNNAHLLEFSPQKNSFLQMDNYCEKNS